METKELFIRQLSVIIENKKGAFADWALLLSENNIDLIAAAIADIGERGTLRAIVSDPQRAYELLCEKRYAVSLTDVIAVPLLDHPARWRSCLICCGITISASSTSIPSCAGWRVTVWWRCVPICPEPPSRY